MIAKAIICLKTTAQNSVLTGRVHNPKWGHISKYDPENICRKISSLFQLNRLPIYFNSPITDNSLFKPVINGNQLKGTGPDLSALVSFKY